MSGAPRSWGRVSDEAESPKTEENRRVTGPFEILQRARGGKDVQFHAATGQDLAIFLGGFLEGATLGTAGDSNGMGRGRVKEPEDSKDTTGTDQEKGGD